MNSPAVIITGASKGLGAAIAKAATSAGAVVIINARSRDTLMSVASDIRASGGRALAIPGDVTNIGDCRHLVARAIEEFGRIDAVVNNAGIAEPIARIADVNPKAWERNLEVNVLGPLQLTQSALPYLRRNSGRVINISSGLAEKAMVANSAYCVSKAGLNQFTRVLALEEPDITALVVRPGAVDTSMQEVIRNNGDKMLDRDHEMIVHLYTEGKLLPPELPGRVIALLALYAPHQWSGDLVSWDDQAVQELMRQIMHDAGE